MSLKKPTKFCCLLITNKNCTLLQESNCWIADGAFELCPNIFYLLYIIQNLIKFGNHIIFVPLINTLMTSKTGELYVKIF